MGRTRKKGISKIKKILLIVLGIIVALVVILYGYLLITA